MVLGKGVRERPLLVMFLAHLFALMPVQGREGTWVLTGDVWRNVFTWLCCGKVRVRVRVVM